MPKPNMYQSLHTTLIGNNGQPFEIQIRTFEMHRTAEYGIAAHWKYKESGSGQIAAGDEEAKLSWLRQILEWQPVSYTHLDVYKRQDVKRFQKFVQIEHLREELRNGKNTVICTYRCREGKGYRWHIMEIVPDAGYTHERQTVVLYVKDVHDVYRKGCLLYTSCIQHIIMVSADAGFFKKLGKGSSHGTVFSETSFFPAVERHADHLFQAVFSADQHKIQYIICLLYTSRCV